MLKVIFFDFDHTTFSHTQNRYPESTIEGLTRLQKKGITVVLNTGRTMSELRDFNLDFNFDYYIVANGQLCYDKQKNPIFKIPFTPQQTEELVEEFNLRKFPLSIVEENEAYINMMNQWIINAQNDIGSPMLPVKEYTGNPVFAGALYGNQQIENEFRQRHPGFTIHRYSPNGLDILANNSGKHTAIDVFDRIVGFDLSETMGFGDGENDVDMLKHVNYAVCMGNGCDAAKEVADYITDTIDNDGLFKALVALKLI